VIRGALVTVGSYLHKGEAEVGRAHLAAEGIAAVVIADDEGGLNPGFYADYRVRLAVQLHDRFPAAAVLGPAGLGVPMARQIHDAIVAHACFCAPEEACGLLAIDGAGALRMAYCLTNVDASPTRFTVAPSEHFLAIRHAERNDWTISGAFHSHPASAAMPSPADIAGALEPGWLHVIAGPLSSPEVRGFVVIDGEAVEVPLRVQ
jgi:proteasome lid subunit RPN8/RPN11